MAKASRWTAIATYLRVLAHLRGVWTEREGQRFVDEVERTVRYIVLHPKGFRSAGHQRLREAPVKPCNALAYRIDKDATVILGLFDMRRHPKHLRELKRGWERA